MTPDSVQGLDVLPEYTDQPAIPDHLTAIWNALMGRAVPRFASDAQRDVGIPAPVDGMLAWVDTGTIETLYLRASGGWRQIWPLDGAYGTEMKPFTPTLGGGWSIGNGSVTASYQQVGKMVDFTIEIVVGSTTVVSNNGITLPVGRRGGSAAPARVVGEWAAFDASATGAATRRAGFVHIAAGTAVTFLIINPDGSSISATSPWTWATGDTITITGRYEAA